MGTPATDSGAIKGMTYQPEDAAARRKWPVSAAAWPVLPIINPEGLTLVRLE